MLKIFQPSAARRFLTVFLASAFFVLLGLAPQTKASECGTLQTKCKKGAEANFHLDAQLGCYTWSCVDSLLTPGGTESFCKSCLDTSDPSTTCGDLPLDGQEECELDKTTGRLEFGKGGSTACSDWLGTGYIGTVDCYTEICRVNTDNCRKCGNGKVEAGELCDYIKLGNLRTSLWPANAAGSAPSCQQFKPGSKGTLSCNDDCTINTSKCIFDDTKCLNKKTSDSIERDFNTIACADDTIRATQPVAKFPVFYCKAKGTTMKGVPTVAEGYDGSKNTTKWTWKCGLNNCTVYQEAACKSNLLQRTADLESTCYNGTDYDFNSEDAWIDALDEQSAKNISDNEFYCERGTFVVDKNDNCRSIDKYYTNHVSWKCEVKDDTNNSSDTTGCSIGWKPNTACWQTAGTSKHVLETAEVEYPDIAFTTNGILYAAYIRGGEAVVKIYTAKGKSWRGAGGNLGDGVISSGVGHVSNIKLAIGSDSIPYVVYVEKTDGIYPSVIAKKYVSGSWVELPLIERFNQKYLVLGSLDMALDKSNKPYVVYDTGVGAGMGRVKHYNGTSWDTVAGDIGPGQGTFDLNIALDANDRPYIGYEGLDVFKANVVRLSSDGKSWEYYPTKAYGQNFSKDVIGYSDIILKGNQPIFAARRENANYAVDFYTSNGSAWANYTNAVIYHAAYKKGNETYDDISLALSAHNEPYIAYGEFKNGNANSKGVLDLYNPTSKAWENVCADTNEPYYFSTNAVTYQKVAVNPVDGKPYVIYMDRVVDRPFVKFANE